MCSAACVSNTNYNVPSYRKWLDTSEGETLQAFRFHKRFLQHLQHCSPLDGRQWVLKCPEHVFALDAIRSVYPDARVIFVHRDPVRVLLSVAKLTEVLRRPFTRELNRREIGRQESARWLDGTMRMIAASDHPKLLRSHIPCGAPGSGREAANYLATSICAFRHEHDAGHHRCGSAVYSGKA